MGYELTLIIARKGYDHPVYERKDDGSHVLDAKGNLVPTGERAVYCRVLMSLELGKIGGAICDLGDKRPGDDEMVTHYFFPVGGNGNEETKKDRYGQRFAVRGLQETINAMEAYCAKHLYAGALVALEALQSMMKHRGNEDLVVLFFGH